MFGYPYLFKKRNVGKNKICPSMAYLIYGSIIQFLRPKSNPKTHLSTHFHLTKGNISDIIDLQVVYGSKRVDFLKTYKICILLFNLIQNMTGVIKKLTDKGFGFISAEGMEKDVFFHGNSLVNVRFDELREGDTVTFDVEDSPKGKNAVNVNKA